MLRRLVGLTLGVLVMALLIFGPRASADGDGTCPPGTEPVSVGSGVICVVVTDPGNPGGPGHPGDPGDGGEGPEGCYKSDGSQVPCHTGDGYWWSAYQCYAAPYDAPPGSLAWQGHTDGSLWQCTSCEDAGTATTCHVQIIWTAPGEEPGPPTQEEMASIAVGQLPLKTAELHTAPGAPAPTYVGVENWLWIPESQWTRLSKSVTAGATTVTVIAAPEQVLWNLGSETETCHDHGKAWVAGMTDAAITTCSHIYKVSSVGEPDGAFAISATIKYHVTWTCTGTCPTTSGDLGIVAAPSGTSEIRVLQRQTVVVQ